MLMLDITKPSNYAKNKKARRCRGAECPSKRTSITDRAPENDFVRLIHQKYA